MTNDTFDILFLIARPAAGKSEIIDYLKHSDEAERRQRFHIGAFDEIGLPVEHFDGAAWDTLTSIADRGIRNAAISELGRHVERLSVMSAEGKA